LEELSDGSLDSLASQETAQRKEQPHQNRFVHADIFHAKIFFLPPIRDLKKNRIDATKIQILLGSGCST
jgi:hypothetical protein